MGGGGGSQETDIEKGHSYLEAPVIGLSEENLSGTIKLTLSLQKFVLERTKLLKRYPLGT